MDLNEKISRLRKQKGLSQEEFANQLNVSRQAVFKWESGDNTPDLEKIKRIAKIFNISLDDLLDDDKELPQYKAKENVAQHTVETKTIIVEKQIKEEPKMILYRKVFDSNIRLNMCQQADFNHGYIDGKRKINVSTFDLYLQEHQFLLNKKSFSKIIRIQNDLLVDFFIDNSNKTFGFFFDGAIQFMCPFENLSSFTISNSGPRNLTRKRNIIGLGIGRNPSFAVGSMPISEIGQPLRYDVIISYLDYNHILKDYKISFGTTRLYIFFTGEKNIHKKIDFFQDYVSQDTNKNLNEMGTYLNGIKDLGYQIQKGTIKVKPLNNIDYDLEVKNGIRKKEIALNGYLLEVANEKRNHYIVTVIAIVVIIVIVLLLVLFF